MNPTIKPIKGMPGYLVGSDGSVWSLWRTRRRQDGGRGVESFIGSALKRMKPRRHSAGYLQMALRRDGEYVYFLLHRLVLETFVGPCPEGMECLHADGDKHNCELSNLRWGTREENVQDSIKHGTFYNATRAAAEANRGRRRVFTDEHRANISAAMRGKRT